MATTNFTQTTLLLYSALGVAVSFIFSLIIYIYHSKIRDFEKVDKRFRETLLILFDKVDQLTKKMNCIKVEQGKQMVKLSNIENNCSKNHK